MTKLPKSLPLVGSSVGPGLDPIRDFEKLKLGNVVLLWLPDSKQEALDVVRYCRDRKIYMMLSEIVKRHNHKRLHCENLSKQDLEEIIAEAGDYFLGRYAIGEAGGMFYWPKSYVINAQAGQYVNMPACRNEAEAHVGGRKGFAGRERPVRGVLDGEDALPVREGLSAHGGGHVVHVPRHVAARHDDREKGAWLNIGVHGRHAIMRHR